MLSLCNGWKSQPVDKIFKASPAPVFHGLKVPSTPSQSHDHLTLLHWVDQLWRQRSCLYSKLPWWRNLSCNINASDAVRGQVDVCLPVPHRAVAVDGAGGGVGDPGRGDNTHLRRSGHLLQFCPGYWEACQFRQSPTSLPVALAQSAREVTVAACDWVQQVSRLKTLDVQQTRSWHRTSDAQKVTGLEMFNWGQGLNLRCVYVPGWTLEHRRCRRRCRRVRAYQLESSPRWTSPWLCLLSPALGCLCCTSEQKKCVIKHSSS